jgi:hypothetical protein
MERVCVSFEVFLGYFTGLHLLAPEMAFETLLRTTLVINTCDAVMCRLLAHNNGHRKNLWTLLGFILGIWAVATLLLLPRRAVVTPHST